MKFEYVGATEDQVQYAGDDPRSVLEINGLYKVKAVNVQPWYTLLKLCGIQGWFNSVCFSPSVHSVATLLPEGISDFTEG